MEQKLPIGALLKITVNGIEQSMNARVTALGLTAAQSHVMHYICRRSGQVHQRDVEQAFELSHATVSGLIDRLESKGFIRRARGEADGRCIALYATEKALEYEERIHGYIQENEAQMLRGLSPEEEDTLRKALQTVLTNLGMEPCCKKEPREEETT